MNKRTISSLIIILAVAGLFRWGLAQAAQVQLKNDSGNANDYSINYALNDVVGSVLQADTSQYPLRVDEINFLLHRVPEWDTSIALQARVYGMDGTGGQPGTLLGASEITTITLTTDYTSPGSC